MIKIAKDLIPKHDPGCLTKIQQFIFGANTYVIKHSAICFQDLSLAEAIRAELNANTIEKYE